MGRILPRVFQTLFSPIIYPLLTKGYRGCQLYASATTCKTSYVLLTRFVWLLVVLFLLAYVYNIYKVYQILCARATVMCEKNKRIKKNWLPLSTRPISKENYEKFLQNIVSQVSNKKIQGLLDLGSEIDVQLTQESVAILGGGPAVLLQLAHPFVAWAIAEHSYSMDNVQRRFYNTFKSVFAITFGNVHTAESASKRVFYTHIGIEGHVRESIGQYRQDAQYAALDENAAIWVLATLIDYEMVMYELFVRDLSSEEKEAHYQFHRKVCGVWGIDGSVLPPTYEEFMDYCWQMWHSDCLVVVDEAKTMADFLLRPLPWEKPFRLKTYTVLTAFLIPKRLAVLFDIQKTIAHEPSSVGVASYDPARTSDSQRSQTRAAQHVALSITVGLCGVCLAGGMGRLVYGLLPIRWRRLTGAARRESRLLYGHETVGLVARVGQSIGNWFVNAVLSTDHHVRVPKFTQNRRKKQ